MKTKIILTLALPFFLLGCGKSSNTQSAPQYPPVTVSEWDKVKISESGEVIVNQKPVSMAELATECQRLREVHGGIKVYCGVAEIKDIAAAQAPPLHLLMSARVPLRTVQKESDLE
jgi:hypothetical protein